MPLIDITNPDVIKFLVESYDKTARLRMRWNHVHKDKLEQAATLHHSEKGYYEEDVLKEAMGIGMLTLTRDSISGATNRRKIPIRDGVHIPSIGDLKKGHSIVDVGLGSPEKDPRLVRPDTDLSIDPKMRPVDPKQKNIIYKGIPSKGRVAYIKSRNKISPEDKYYFRETSGWEYGWRLRDSYFSHNASKCGRVWLLTRGSSSRSGPQPDPAHYKTMEQRGPNKCSL